MNQINECSCDNSCTTCIDLPQKYVETRMVDGKDILHNYPGSYVFVRDENTNYKVSCPGPNCLPSSSPVAHIDIFKDDYHPDPNKKYRGLTVYDFLRNKAYVYDFNGDYRSYDLT